LKNYSETDYPLQDITYQMIGIGMTIHRILGKGSLEVVYKDAFEFELAARNIAYEREKEFIIQYKNIVLPHRF
jgi:GxxExxY protein